MSRFRTVLGVLLAVGLSGCGGFSTEDAEARCTQEQDARNGTSCLDDDALSACVTAYEECGEDVDLDDTACPVTFTCPE